MNIARTVVTHLYEVDPNQPAGKIQSLEQVRAESIAAPRLTTNLLGLFALLALAIAAAGIGGVMALSVSQRIHEIGVRMAIGARPVEIVAMILRQGMGLALIGVVLGLAAAFALTQSVRSFLFRVTPTDPLTFVGVAAVFDDGRVRRVLHPRAPRGASRSVASLARGVVGSYCSRLLQKFLPNIPSKSRHACACRAHVSARSPESRTNFPFFSRFTLALRNSQIPAG